MSSKILKIVPSDPTVATTIFSSQNQRIINPTERLDGDSDAPTLSSAKQYPWRVFTTMMHDDTSSYHSTQLWYYTTGTDPRRSSYFGGCPERTRSGASLPCWNTSWWRPEKWACTSPITSASAATTATATTTIRFGRKHVATEGTRQTPSAQRSPSRGPIQGSNSRWSNHNCRGASQRDGLFPSQGANEKAKLARQSLGSGAHGRWSFSYVINSLPYLAVAVDGSD